MIAPRLVRRTHLVMRAPSALRPARPLAPDLAARVRLGQRRPCTAAEYRALYRMVGERWHWRDRNAWSDARLAAWLARPDIAVWVLTVDGAPAGYFEMQRHARGEVEILYFGLAEGQHGRGLGGWMLEQAVREAWRMGAAWVGLNTCTLDGPTALSNYLARGFVPYRTEEYVTVV